MAERVLAQEMTAPLPAPAWSCIPADPGGQPDSPALECADGKIVHANPAAARLAGRDSPSELIGLALDDVLTGPDSDADLHRPDGSVVGLRVLRWTPPGGGTPVLLLADVSDLRATRGVLQDERTRLTETQRISRTGSFTKDLATGQLSFSDALLEIFAQRGVDPARDPRFSVHPDDRAAVFELEQRAIADPDGDTYEYEFRGESAGRYVCQVRAERSSDGRPDRIVGTIQDVTAARTLERELREERRRLGQAQRVAGIGTWEWCPVSGDLVWSEMLCELYGVRHGGAADYHTYLSLVHPNDREWLDELWRRLAADHHPVECEHRLCRPDGSVRTFRCHGAAVRDPDGLVRLVGTAQDVTEHRLAESRVERSDQRFTDLVAVAPVGIGLVDDHDRLVDANDALCRLLGYHLETLRGISTAELTHPDERDDPLTLHDADARSYTLPQRKLARADGAPVYCELHVARSVRDNGQRFGLVVFADVTERRRVAEALRYQTRHDELTGLGNRTAVTEVLGELLTAGTVDAGTIAVLFCDIDNFKRVNDSLGHDAGDELLVALARRLEDGLPADCFAARLSGDVYVVICPDAPAHGGVQSLVNRVGGLLRAAVPVRGQLLRVSAAIGVAVPDGKACPEDVLRFADTAMSHAKRQGAGKVELASAALITTADRQVPLEGELRDALTDDELELYFQPVVGSSGAVLAAEALVRWAHPEQGVLPPDQFLPVAEQGDLMRELDKWVLRSALAHARDWRDESGSAPAVAVNLSGLVPGVPGFVDTIATAVAESGIAWDRVVLELVETALVDLPSSTRRCMAELIDRGIRFAVDDFGTGYSSLARLKELPAQIVKIDRRFVAGVDTDLSDFAVARAVVDMARAMGRSCVAEGVETAAQYQVLRDLGVQTYQGWLFSRPIAAREFRTMASAGPLHLPVG